MAADFLALDLGDAWFVAPGTVAAAARLSDVSLRGGDGAALAQRVGPALVVDAREAPTWAGR